MGLATTLFEEKDLAQVAEAEGCEKESGRGQALKVAVCFLRVVWGDTRFLVGVDIREDCMRHPQLG